MIRFTTEVDACRFVDVQVMLTWLAKFRDCDTNIAYYDHGTSPHIYIEVELHGSTTSVVPGNWLVRNSEGEFYSHGDKSFRVRYKPLKGSDYE